jgi:hypothetical protein
VNTLAHTLINVSVASISGLNINDVIVIGAAGAIIDIDHLLSYYKNNKNLDINKFISWTYREYKKHNPHFNIFHTSEIILALIFFGSLQSRFILLIGVGFLIHSITDMLTYFYYYRSFKPWLMYFSFLSYYL